jgi:hypothetical protein
MVSTDEPKKYCKACLIFKIHVEVERYHNMKLDYCTYHYYMMKGREGGQYSLESYAEASRLHSFKTSLPSAGEIALLRRAESS